MNFSGAFGGLAAAVGQERDALRIGTTDSDGLLLTTVTTAGLPFPFASLPHFSFAPRMMFSNALTAQPGHMMMLSAPGIHQQLMASYANGGVPNNVDVLPPTHRPTHRTHVHHGYVGLPYQDHNYVAPLPCTPPHSPVLASAKTHQIQLDDVSYHTTVTTSNVKEVVVSSTGPPDIPPCDDSVTRCICDFQHDDGYMICCDNCGVWQHVDCMRVDRMNIPESYLCELCEPRPVDKHRAIQIQTKKRDDLSLLPMDSSATETEDETTQDDSSSLHNGRKKLRKDFDDMAVLGSKKRTKRMHKDDSPKKKWHLKMRNNGLSDNKLLLSPQKPILSRHQSFGGISNDGFTVPEEALNGSMPGSLAVTPTEALFAAVECVTAYQDASCNCYTPELQNLLASIRFNGQHTSGPHWPPVVGCAEIAAQLAQHQPCRVASVTGSKMGLEATDDIITHQPLVEYVGNVMLRDQYDCGVPSSESVQPYVLFYTKLDGLDLCVDARLYGNEARFVRRSCTPNAEVRHVLDGSTVRFFIHATKSIIRGAEITIPFDFNYHKCTSHVECACTRLSCPVAKYQKQRELNHLPSAAKRQRVTRSVDSRLPLTTMQEVNPLPPVTTPSKMPVQTSVSMTTRNRKPPPLLHLNSEPLQTQQSNMTPETTTPAIDIDVSAKSTPLPLMSPVKTPRSQQIPTSAPTSAGSSETETHPIPNCSHSDSDDGEKSKKKTREEKKLEAIVKAFERMEKREERKKEALARMEHSRKKQNKEKDSVTIKTEPDADLSLDSSSNWEQSVDVKQETPIPEKEKVKSENVPSKSKKSRQSSSSRRASINVSAPPQTISAATTVGTAAAQPVVTAIEQPAVETTSNATVAASSCDEEVSSGLPTNMPPVVSDDGVPPAVCPAVPTIHFPKKLMMRGHEARRMSAAADLNRPLTVQTDGPDVNDSSSEAEYMTCVPSPHTFSLSSLRRDSLTGKGLGGASAGDTRGSAKKRWLQKAMFESTKTVTVTLSDGITSVAGTDSMGGNTVCTAASLSPAGDFVTPLKKRRLARESLSIDGSIAGIAEEDDSPSTHALSPCATPCSIGSGVNRQLPGGSLGESSSDSRDDVWSQIVNRLRTTISSVPKLNGDECGPSVIGSVGVVYSEPPNALCSPHFQIGHVNGPTHANLINSNSIPVAVCASDYLHNISNDNFHLEAVSQAMISCNSSISDRLPVPSSCGIASSCFPLEVSRTRNDSVGSVSEQSEQPVPNRRVRSYSGISLVSISSNSTGEESPRLDAGTQPVVSDDGSCLEFNREHNQDLEYAAHLSKFGIVGVRSLPVNGIPVTTAGGWFLPGYHPANMGAFISAAAENSAPNTLTPLVSMSVLSSNSNSITSLTADHRTSEGTWQTGLTVPLTWSQNPSTEAQFVHPFHQDPGTSAAALSQSSVNWCSLNNSDSHWNPSAALSDSFVASRSPPYRLGIGQEYVLAASCVPGTCETSLAAASVTVIGSPVWSANFDTTSNGSFTDVTAGCKATSAMCSSTPLSAASSKKKVSLLEYRQRMSQRSTENLTLLNMSPSHSSPAVVPLTMQHMSSEVCGSNDTSSEKGQLPESLCNGNYGQSSSVEGSSHSSEESLRHETVTDVNMPLSSGSDSSDVGSVTYASKSDGEVFLASASGSIVCDTAVPRRRLVDMDGMRSNLDDSQSVLRVEHEAKQDIGLSVSEQPAPSYSL